MEEVNTEIEGHPRRWAVLGVLVICILVVILDNTILNVALKTIQEQLGASQSQMEWAINSYTLVFAGLMFTAGVLGDRYGRRLFLVLGLVFFGIASALSAFTDSAGQLITTRALMGIGAAMIMPQTLSIVTNVFGPKERGKAIGIWAGVGGMAIALGPITGGFLLEHFWWGSVFLVNVPVVIIGTIAAMAIIPESRDPNPKPLDPVGVILSIVGITAIVYGIIKGGETSQWSTVETLGPIIGGIVLLTTFVLLERRSSHPSLDVSLFKKAEFSAATVALAIVFFAMMGLIFAGSFYLQAVRDFDPLKAGALIVPVSLGISLTAPFSAKTAARFGAKRTVAVGMFLAGAALGGYFFLTETTSLWYFEIMLFVMGLGMGNVMAPATESMMSAVPREKAGAGSAVNTTMRMVAGALGVAILGSLLSIRYRANLGDNVNALPEGQRHEAGESIGKTFQAIGDVVQQIKAGQLPASAGAGLDKLADAAKDSFVSGMHSVAIVSMLVAWFGALVTVLWLPNKTDKSPATTPAAAPAEVESDQEGSDRTQPAEVIR